MRPLADALEHGPVAGLVEREQRVRRDALLGPLARQPALGAGGQRRSLPRAMPPMAWRAHPTGRRFGHPSLTAHPTAVARTPGSW